jgi:CHAT domain
VGNRGYFILPGPLQQKPRLVPVEDLAPLLANSRFVYLSSCDSASAKFVFRLANHGIPSLLGFRVKIRDSLAEEHATEFYGHLFRTRSLEDAFPATRRHFFQTKPESRVWAQVLLIQQN